MAGAIEVAAQSFGSVDNYIDATAEVKVASIGEELQDLGSKFVVEFLFVVCLAAVFGLTRRRRIPSKKNAKTARRNSSPEAAVAEASPEVACVRKLAEVGDEEGILRVAENKPRCYIVALQTLFESGQHDVVLRLIRSMSAKGFTPPSHYVTDLFRWAVDAGRSREVLERTKGIISLSPEACSLVLADCLRREDLQLAILVYDMAQATDVYMNISAYDSLLKIFAQTGDARSVTCFEEMQRKGLRISEGLCVALLSRCATSKYLSFAGKVVEYARGRGKLTLNMYSTLMKVYAYSGQYNKACGVYDELVAEGLKPDTMMCSCLMKFAAECGRTDIIISVGETLPKLDSQHYIFLIRSCVQTKDLKKAFELFNAAKANGCVTDTITYNVLLDVCVAAGNMQGAEHVLEEMLASKGLVDEVTFNVMLKGYCAAGDSLKARNAIRQMEEAGVKPSCTAYNCLLNMAVSNRRDAEAWSIIEIMHKSGLPADKYSVSTMMKVVKTSEEPARDLVKVLELLDRSGLDICSDDVLLVGVLEACVKQRLLQRVKDILERFEGSPAILAKIALHTHAVIIKAYGTLGRVSRCWTVWESMIQQRGLQPSSIVVGCMVDALVCNDCVDDAFKLLEDTQALGVEPNAVIFATLMKGVVAQRRIDEAIVLLAAMRKRRVKPTTSTYNCLIDACAKLGQTERVAQFVAEMEKDGCVVNEITHSVVMKSFILEGNLDQAVKYLYDVAKKTNGQNMTSAYNSALDACIRADRRHLCAALVQDMDQLKIKPTLFTLTTHIKYYGRVRQIESALKAVETWPKKYKVFANLATKTCLIRACHQQGAVESCRPFITDVIKAPQGIDSKGCRSMMQTLLEAELLEDAAAFAQGICSCNGNASRSSDLDSDLVQQLLQALLRRAHKEQELSAKMGERKVSMQHAANYVNTMKVLHELMCCFRRRGVRVCSRLSAQIAAA